MRGAQLFVSFQSLMIVPLIVSCSYRTPGLNVSRSPILQVSCAKKLK